MTAKLSIALGRGSRWVVGLLFQIVLLCLAGRASAAVTTPDAAEISLEAQSCEQAADGAQSAVPISCGGPATVVSRSSQPPMVAQPAAAGEGVDVARGAPMCDPTAASIVARVEIPEIDRGRFEPLPCPDPLLALLADAAGHWASKGDAASGLGRHASAPHAPSALERLDGARLSPLFFPVRAAPRVLGALAAAGIGFSAGHPRAIERPPARR